MFLVLKLQRTGSSLFCAVLNSHPDVNCSSEILNKIRDAPKTRQLSLMRQFYSPLNHCSDETNVANLICGASLNPFKHHLTSTDLNSVLEQQAEKLNVICLTRSNKLKQALSILVAEQFSWHSSLTHFESRSDVRKKRTFDVERLKQMVRGLEFQSKQLRSMAQTLSISTLKIEYETICCNFATVFSGVFDHIGASPVTRGFDHQAGYKKILPDNIEEIVGNFDELRSDGLLATYF